MLLAKKLAMDRGWSVSRLSREAGLNQSSVHMIVSGRLKPYPHQAQALADALEYLGDPAELFVEVDDDRS